MRLDGFIGPGHVSTVIGCRPYAFIAREYRRPVVISGFEPLDLLQSMAQRKNVTAGQVALAWLLAQRPWIVPIPGTTKAHRLEENVDAADVKLTADDLAVIDSAASQITIHGARYPEAMERMSNR